MGMIVPEDLSINRRRLEMLPVGAARAFGALDATDVRDAWAGLRPCTGDGLPAIGASRVAGLWIATGHAMMGFCLGPVTGRLIAGLIEGEPSPVPLGAFDPHRFG